jgi:gliding motility-associated lipoprotein GldD
MKKIVYFFCGMILLVLYACNDTPLPKPDGYFRIELPQQNYQRYITDDCSFSFDYAQSAVIEKQKNCFLNISYPKLNAKFHISYVEINNNLNELIDQEYEMREKHNAFASSVKELVFQNPNKNVNALVFDISGKKAATPLQFFISDSTKHFFRGSLYFYNSPNNDSLAPVIEFLKEDLNRLIESFEWK